MGHWRQNKVEQVSETSNAGDEWQEMAKTVTLERDQAERAQLLRERQQRRIIGYFMHGDDPQYLNMSDVELDAGMRTNFLHEINYNKITKQDEETLLLKIARPIDQPKYGMGAGAVFDKVARDSWQLQLLSLMTNTHLDKDGHDAGASAVADLVNSRTSTVDLRTPVGFAQKRQELMDRIRLQVDQVNYEKYEKSMDQLEHNLYGKQFEYYQAFEGLRDEARKLRGGEPAEKLVSGQEVYRLSAEQSHGFIQSAKVEGDIWSEGGRNYRLTPEILESAGLAPKYVMNIEKRMVALSDVFELPNRRAVVEAYIPTKDGVKVRSYYQSNSQGVWRYLPDYVRDDQGRGKIKWYGKGRGEESLTLPHELQKALRTIEMSAGRIPSHALDMNPFFYFAGTAKAYSSKEEYNQYLAREQMRGDYYQEVSAKPYNMELGATGVRKRPEAVAVSYEDEPDFSQVKERYKSEADLAGTIQTEVFQSRDGQKEWLFCMDERCRSYVGGVEIKSPITSTGLRQKWASGGNITTPLYEYESQTDGYGDRRDVKKKYYQGMWSNYLSRIPLIRKYLSSKAVVETTEKAA